MKTYRLIEFESIPEGCTMSLTKGIILYDKTKDDGREENKRISNDRRS